MTIENLLNALTVRILDQGEIRIFDLKELVALQEELGNRDKRDLYSEMADHLHNDRYDLAFPTAQILLRPISDKEARQINSRFSLVDVKTNPEEVRSIIEACARFVIGYVKFSEGIHAINAGNSADALDKFKIAFEFLTSASLIDDSEWKIPALEALLIIKAVQGKNSEARLYRDLLVAEPYNSTNCVVPEFDRIDSQNSPGSSDRPRPPTIN